MPPPEKVATAASLLSAKNLNHLVAQMVATVVVVATSFLSLMLELLLFSTSIIRHIAKQLLVHKDMAIARMELLVKI